MKLINNQFNFFGVWNQQNKRTISSQWSVAQWLAKPLLVPEVWAQILAGLLSQIQIEN